MPSARVEQIVRKRKQQAHILPETLLSHHDYRSNRHRGDNSAVCTAPRCGWRHRHAIQALELPFGAASFSGYQSATKRE